MLYSAERLSRCWSLGIRIGTGIVCYEEWDGGGRDKDDCMVIDRMVGIPV